MLQYTFLFIFFLPIISATVHMETSDWQFLESHPVKNKIHIDANLLSSIVAEEWAALCDLCIGLDRNAKINAYFDNSLEGKTTLAWASHTMYLNGLIWLPALTNPFYTGYDFTIGVNPSPPNGWFNGECSEISFRYDLRSVIRHELLHGVGLSSSISFDNSWSVGSFTSGLCFPRLYDTLIRDPSGNLIVSGCNVQDISGKRLYLGDVELYNPYVYDEGSSISHHNYPGKLFYYRSTPMKCMYVSSTEVSMLGLLGVGCSPDSRSASVQKANLEPILLFLLSLCILVIGLY